MTEEKMPEVELKDKPAAGVCDAFDAVVSESVRLVDSLSKALIATAEDISSLMIIKVDADTREQLDLLVETGYAPNRRKAARTLVIEGVEMREETFERIRRTKAQIAALRTQMRNLVDTHVA